MVETIQVKLEEDSEGFNLLLPPSSTQNQTASSKHNETTIAPSNNGTVAVAVAETDVLDKNLAVEDFLDRICLVKLRGKDAEGNADTTKLWPAVKFGSKREVCEKVKQVNVGLFFKLVRYFKQQEQKGNKVSGRCRIAYLLGMRTIEESFIPLTSEDMVENFDERINEILDKEEYKCNQKFQLALAIVEKRYTNELSDSSDEDDDDDENDDSQSQDETVALDGGTLSSPSSNNQADVDIITIEDTNAKKSIGDDNDDGTASKKKVAKQTPKSKCRAPPMASGDVNPTKSGNRRTSGKDTDSGKEEMTKRPREDSSTTAAAKRSRGKPKAENFVIPPIDFNSIKKDTAVTVISDTDSITSPAIVVKLDIPNMKLKVRLSEGKKSHWVDFDAVRSITSITEDSFQTRCAFLIQEDIGPVRPSSKFDVSRASLAYTAPRGTVRPPNKAAASGIGKLTHETFSKFIMSARLLENPNEEALAELLPRNSRVRGDDVRHLYRNFADCSIIEGATSIIFSRREIDIVNYYLSLGKVPREMATLLPYRVEKDIRKIAKIIEDMGLCRSGEYLKMLNETVGVLDSLEKRNEVTAQPNPNAKLQKRPDLRQSPEWTEEEWQKILREARLLPPNRARRCEILKIMRQEAGRPD